MKKSLAKKVFLAASESPYAQKAAEELSERYDFAPLKEAEVIVVAGGDGFMLDALHKLWRPEVKFYGMNLGTVGFLLNPVSYDDLDEKILLSEPAELTPLECVATDKEGQEFTHYAFNDVSVLRKNTQSAHLQILTDGSMRIEKLIGDGVIVATPAGSSAYNASAGGPVLPLTSGILAMTPICTSSHKHWRGALLNATMNIEVVNLDPDKRPVVADIDSKRIEDTVSIRITSDPSKAATLLFDPGHELEERIQGLQFA